MKQLLTMKALFTGYEVVSSTAPIYTKILYLWHSKQQAQNVIIPTFDPLVHDLWLIL